MRALIADDDEALCKLISYKLEKRGYSVAEAADGQQVLDILSSQRIDVLILDIMLPKVDGFFLLKEIQTNERLTPRAVVVLSARGEDEDIVRAFELGAVDYVTKPFSMNVLMARVEVAMKAKARPEKA